jgi:tRNA A37 threonylcarbamoyladenosine biosynthesis protein TsaE
MNNQADYGKLSFYNTVKPEPLSWLWYPYIAAGKLSLLSGDPGDGKTTLALTIAAHITTGRALPET